MEVENNEKKEKNNKRIIIGSAVVIVVLVLTIAATSYAMFTADLSGTEENKLTTGYVKLECTEETFELTDATEMSDADGIASENNAAKCTLVSTINGQIKIGYDIALADVDSLEPNDYIGINNVKIQASKKINDGTTSYLAGSSATSGVYVSNLTNTTGAYDDTITGYNIDSAIVEESTTIVYTIKAWVSSLGENVNSSVTGDCTDPQYTTEATCETAGEIWGNSKTTKQEGGKFSFKLKVGATQTFDN